MESTGRKLMSPTSSSFSTTKVVVESIDCKTMGIADNVFIPNGQGRQLYAFDHSFIGRR